MNDLAFKTQNFILNLRKNLRYSIMLVPIVTIFLLPVGYFGARAIVGSFLKPNAGIISTNVQILDNSLINITDTGAVALSNNKKLFYAKLNNRENTTFGFPKLFYKVSYVDDAGIVVENDNTIYRTFVLPKEDFYLVHTGPSSATGIKVSFDMTASQKVNASERDLIEIDKKLVEISNLKIDTTDSNSFTVSLTLSNISGKDLKNLVMQYRINGNNAIGGGADGIAYLGNIVFTEIKANDNQTRIVGQNIPYPFGINKNNLQFTPDFNKLFRYNIYDN
jgi:hypothetical protein